MYHYDTYQNVSTALRNQILEAVDEAYYSALKDPIVGFSNVTPLAILDHLKQNYGTVTPDMLIQNEILWFHLVPAILSALNVIFGHLRGLFLAS